MQLIKASFWIKVIQYDPLHAFFGHSVASDKGYAEVGSFRVIIEHESHVDVQLSEVSFCYAVIFRVFVNDEAVIDAIIVHADKSGRFVNLILVIEHLRYVWVGLLDGAVLLPPPDIPEEPLEKQYAEPFLRNKYFALVLALVSILFHTCRVSSIKY